MPVAGSSLRAYGWLTARLVLTVVVTMLVFLAVMDATPRPSQMWLTVYFGLFLIAVWLSLHLAYRRSAISFVIRVERDENRFEPLHLLLPPFALIGLFLLTCRQLESFDPSFFTLAPTSISEDTRWLLFVLDHVVRAIFLDFFETFLIHVSPIQYTDRLVIEFVVFIFRTVLSIVFWTTLVSLYRGWKSAPK
jgi:hypothetical protein